MIKLPEHLGGHAGITHIDTGAITFIKNKFHIKSAYDVGCGVGGMVKLMNNMNINCTGIDGDFTVNRLNINCIIHDFVKGGLNDIDNVDFIWSVEFLEHVEEKYLDNIFSVFKKANYILCTAASPGTEIAHHHVNCKNSDYWINIFKINGFEYDNSITCEIKKNSTMSKEFMANTGMFYINKNKIGSK